jgi:hypothetical protein
MRRALRVSLLAAAAGTAAPQAAAARVRMQLGRWWRSCAAGLGRGAAAAACRRALARGPSCGGSWTVPAGAERAATELHIST